MLWREGAKEMVTLKQFFERSIGFKRDNGKC